MQKIQRLKNTKLYLHCNPLEHNGVNLLRVLERLNLKLNRDVFFPKINTAQTDTEELNDIYNTEDTTDYNDISKILDHYLKTSNLYNNLDVTMNLSQLLNTNMNTLAHKMNNHNLNICICIYT